MGGGDAGSGDAANVGGAGVSKLVQPPAALVTSKVARWVMAQSEPVAMVVLLMAV